VVVLLALGELGYAVYGRGKRGSCRKKARRIRNRVRAAVDSPNGLARREAAGVEKSSRSGDGHRREPREEMVERTWNRTSSPGGPSQFEFATWLRARWSPAGCCPAPRVASRRETMTVPTNPR